MGVAGVCSRLVAVTLLCGLCGGAFVRREDKSKGCGSSPADIGFILDESGSIYYLHFDLQKEFVNNVIDNFRIGPDKTRIAAMTFSNDPVKVFDFEAYDTDVDIKEAVSGITQRRGNTMTNMALDMALEDMFLGHMRQGVAHVAIVITDGQSDYPDRTAESARRLKSAGITVLAVGVGLASTEELETIASPPAEDHVFKVDSFDALDSLKEKLAWTACQITTTTTTTTTTTAPPQHIEGCNGRRQLDVMFGLPEGVGIQETNTVFDFISSVSDDLNISPIQAQAGLIPQTCSEVEGIRLRDNDDNPGFQRDLDSRRPAGEYSHNQLEFLLGAAYQPENSGRGQGEAVRTAVLIIDSDSEIPAQTLSAAADLRGMGVRVVVIGVGSDRGEMERKQLAFSSEYYMSVASYDELGGAKKFITDRLCDSIRQSGFGGQ